MKKFKLGQLIGNRVILGVDKRPTIYPYLVSDSKVGHCLEKWKEEYLLSEGMEFESSVYNNLHCTWYKEEEVEELIANSFKLGQEVIYKGNTHRIIGVDINDNMAPYFITKEDGASSLGDWICDTGYNKDMLRYIKEEKYTKGIWVNSEELRLPPSLEETSVEQHLNSKKEEVAVNKIEVLKYRITIKIVNNTVFDYVVNGTEELEKTIREIEECMTYGKVIVLRNGIIPTDKVLKIHWEEIKK